VAALGSLRVVWEGDFDELHSLALVNRAICRRLREISQGIVDDDRSTAEKKA